ncbi:MAG TPA: diacylglycerol kinase family protein [Vicinamibacterales bacterium]|jgi:YegS/Rv2252/BmrU family lipid kinase
MSVAIIINPISGGARPGKAQARAQIALAAIERHGDQAEVFITERRGHAHDLAKSAVRRGTRLVLAWGGDGTINEVASALAFEETPLGIIPSGSGNGLATELKISRRPEEAIRMALSTPARAIDLGEIGGRLFANVAGIGFDAHIAEQFNLNDNVRRGFIGYARITSRALFSYEQRPYVVQGDGTFDGRAVLVTIANGAQYGNNARIAPSARADDGWLDLVVVSERSRWETLRYMPRLFNGNALSVPGYSTTRIRRARIESDRPMVFHVDGESVSGGTTLDVRIHPGALLIAAP